MILTSMAVKTASKAAVNLLSRSWMRNRKPRLASSRSISRFMGLLGEPGSGRVGGDAEDVHPAAGVLDDEERVEPVQEGSARLWVPESRRTSRDLLILVDEAAASVASSDLVELGSSAVGDWA
jgi:hypothetical protein